MTVSVETRSGVRVATIASRSVQPGRLLVQWNGTTRGGKALVYGGFYVVRFSTTNELGTVELTSKPVFVLPVAPPPKPKTPKPSG